MVDASALAALAFGESRAALRESGVAVIALCFAAYALCGGQPTISMRLPSGSMTKSRQ